MKYSGIKCDICGKDITTQFQYRFHNWHYRIGKCTKFHMCEKCFEKFKEFVKGGENE